MHLQVETRDDPSTLILGDGCGGSPGKRKGRTVAKDSAASAHLPFKILSFGLWCLEPASPLLVVLNTSFCLYLTCQPLSHSPNSTVCGQVGAVCACIYVGVAGYLSHQVPSWTWEGKL